MARNGSVNVPPSLVSPLNKGLALKMVAPVLAFTLVMLTPTPAGLTSEGQRALAVMALAVVL